MADFISNFSGKRRLPPPRIDLTPMVDLGFLLITFFMFTTTLSESRAMDITMPDTGPTNTPMIYPEESTVTLIPVKGNRVIYYTGDFKKENLDGMPITEVRGFLMNKKKEATRLPATFSKEAHELHVVLKPDDCSFQDMVTLLDEMKITDIPYYTISDLSKEEREEVFKQSSESKRLDEQ